MNHIEIANRAGVSLPDLESLISGSPTNRLARAVGVTMADIEDFISGNASAAMARRLGFSIAAAEELARVAGRNGAIGIIIGILISN